MNCILQLAFAPNVLLAAVAVELTRQHCATTAPQLDLARLIMIGEALLVLVCLLDKQRSVRFGSVWL